MAEGYDSKNISSFKEQCQDLMNMLQVKVDNLGTSTTQKEQESPEFSVFSPVGTPVRAFEYDEMSPRIESTRLTENLMEPYPQYDEESILPSFSYKSTLNTREIFDDGLVDENNREIESPRYKALPQSYFDTSGYDSRDEKFYQTPQNTSKIKASSKATASNPSIIKHFSKDNTQTRHVSFQTGGQQYTSSTGSSYHNQPVVSHGSIYRTPSGPISSCRNQPSFTKLSQQPIFSSAQTQQPILSISQPHTSLTSTGQPAVSFSSTKKQPLVRREKEPDKFDGKSIDWQDYIVHFEQTAQWNGWDDESKAQQLCMSLRGTAQKLLGDAKPSVLSNYALLKEMLTRRFAPKERITAYRCEFNTRTRRKNESLSDYGYALRRLVRLAYPDHDKTEDLAIDQFVKGLDNFEIQKRVQFSHPATLESAIALAIEYEAFVGSTSIEIKKPKDTDMIQAIKKSDKLGKDKTVHEKSDIELEGFKNAILTCIEKLGQKIDEMNQTVVTPHCTKCKRIGHTIKDCKAPTCFKCKRVGHLSRDCRNKPTPNKEQKSESKDTDSLNQEGLG